ncbi:cytochrome c biogenesis CcdA family protein [Geodermatophilus marinus]|uniref:cytochrome c biogenesis CcdA family protein n=1 Tax=Geodermatophilus sp. LHW52908 TaxID=2303986 RepID=UPI000E3D97F6|nr:cytochrome c biogenesis protein CcdA [Geodermatophilus sp. LHW52908]RFU23311.1 cytochrome c biogenesis protein CcdA [Geodermatophilus sp. LHW52908]
MGETFSGLVTDGPLLVAAVVAALVGLVSFASPCVLPLVPGYLSYVTGLAGAGTAAPPPRARHRSGPADPGGGPGAAVAERTAVDERSPRGRMVLGALLFVLGFTVVFVAFGAAFGGLGRLLLQYSDVLTRVLGVVTVVMGLAFLGWLPLLQRTARFSARPVAGLAGAPLLGVVFGLGWTPCLGPTLAAVNSLAYVEATAGRGALLGVAYCAGLGIPFVLVALGARWALGATSVLRRHARTVTRVGGALLVVVGLLLVTGAWTEMMGWLRSWLAATGFAETSL